MRGVRTLLLAGTVVLVVVVGALWWVYASRDALIKSAIERFGPELTGVAVKVSAVSLEPLEGRGAIKGLVVGNPSGFKSPHALSLGEVRLAVEPSTLTSEVVRVKEISLEAPSIVYERGPSGDNLTAIQRHIESQLPKSAPQKDDAKAEKAAKERRFIIDRVQVRNARVSYGGAVNVDVPDLQLRDLGKRQGGATAAEITQEIWTAMTRNAIASAPATLRGLEERAKGAIDSLRDAFK